MKGVCRMVVGGVHRFKGAAPIDPRPIEPADATHTSRGPVKLAALI